MDTREYDVTVQRTEYREHTFRVRACSETEAKEKAMSEEVADHNFGNDTVDHADEQVTAVRALAPTVEPPAGDCPTGEAGSRETYPSIAALCFQRILQDARDGNEVAVLEMLTTGVECSRDLVDHPTIMVRRETAKSLHCSDFRYRLSPLGLLNGILGALTGETLMLREDEEAAGDWDVVIQPPGLPAARVETPSGTVPAGGA